MVEDALPTGSTRPSRQGALPTGRRVIDPFGIDDQHLEIEPVPRGPKLRELISAYGPLR